MAYNLLDVAEVFRTIGAIALAVLILLIMITVHEFGHYLAGKIFHFKINEFAIGFGPAIFKRRSKKTDELFSVRVFPLGGYCAFEGEDGLEEEQTDENGITSVKQPHPDAFTKKPCWQRIIVLVSGALMNYLLALLLIIVNLSVNGQMLPAVYEIAPSAEYAAEYSLHSRDILLEVGGNAVYMTTDIAHAVNGKSKGDLVSVRVSRVTQFDGEGKAVKREEVRTNVMLRADVSVKSSTDFSSVWEAFGVQKGTDGEFLLAHSFYQFDFASALGRSFVYSFKIAGSIFQVIGELFTGRLGLDAFGGPITTITMTSQIASRGFQYFLEIASYIGVNLAVFNLLPIPALDGSKVVFTAIEWVRGKPINRKVEAIIHVVGLALLLGFAVLVDILQFV